MEMLLEFAVIQQVKITSCWWDTSLDTQNFITDVIEL